MPYQIVEIFDTIQGEGFHAGTPAIFVRFAACNLWSGRQEDRARDYQRTGGACALFCDTDFLGGQRLDIVAIVARVEFLRRRSGGSIRHIVFTGGEPLLQLDLDLVLALRHSSRSLVLAVETNGTVEITEALAGELDWICCSPKTPPSRLCVPRIDELKVIVPAMDPTSFLGVAATHLFVQPEAAPDLVQIGKSEIRADSVAFAIRFVLANPVWRLSLQTHKIVGLP
jgi:organic radical activating enzyme